MVIFGINVPIVLVGLIIGLIALKIMKTVSKLVFAVILIVAIVVMLWGFFGINIIDSVSQYL